MSYAGFSVHLDLLDAASGIARSQAEFDAIVDGDLVLGHVACFCGYECWAICSPGWDGPMVPLPTRCPDCGADLGRVPLREGGCP